MKIAVDVNCSKLEIEILQAMGFIVMSAEHGESDEHFFERTDDYLPEIYVSMDADWKQHARKMGASFCRPGKERIKDIFRQSKQRKLSELCL